LCVNACVAAHGDGVFSTDLARLAIQTQALGQHKVLYCTLCKKCIDICPTGALRWHEQTGAVELIVEKCTACDKCVEICPTHVVMRSNTGINELPWYPVICDLCGSDLAYPADPACARICPTGAITLAERSAVK
jgi:Fe-S-cluster-containing hydrogenase component 2